MKYRKEIDGLRALAVLPVIFFHAGFTAFSGGFVGVDIFFVISGYLITTIIVDEMEKGTFSLLGFYERRARRILPALFFVMLCTLPFAWFWMLPEDLKSFSESLVAVPLFISNVLFYLSSNYFETASELKPLLHTWSLAVEEQYYVLFPLFLLLTWRLGKKWIIYMLLLIAIVSALTAQWNSIIHPSFTFYLLPTRGFELIIGALIALYLNHKISIIPASHLVTELVSLAGLALVFYGIFVFDSNTPSPSLYTLVPTFGAGLILIFSNGNNLVGKLLGSKLLVSTGLISYSAYLWHHPLLSFAKLRSLDSLGNIMLSVLCAGSLILGYLSWKYIENPFRNKQKISRRKLFELSILFTFSFIIVGLLGRSNLGFPSRLKYTPIDLTGEGLEYISIPRINNGWCFYSIDTIKNINFGNDGLKCTIGLATNPKLKGILFGDSFAGSYEPFWDYVGKKNKLQINSISTNWCAPSLDKSFSGPLSSRAYEQCLFNREFLRENYKQYDFVILAGMWSDIHKQDQLNGVLELIKKISKDSKLIIVMASPKQYDSNPFNNFLKHFLFDSTFDIKNQSHSRDILAVKANQILLNDSLNYTNVIFLDRDTIFNGDEVSDEGLPLSAEGKHLSTYGSKYIVKNFVKGIGYSNLIERIEK